MSTFLRLSNIGMRTNGIYQVDCQLILVPYRLVELMLVTSPALFPPFRLPGLYKMMKTIDRPLGNHGRAHAFVDCVIAVIVNTRTAPVLPLLVLVLFFSDALASFVSLFRVNTAVEVHVVSAEYIVTTECILRNY